MTLLLSDNDVRAVADMRSCIEGIERVLQEQYDGAAVLPPRLNLGFDGTFLRLMPVQLGKSDIMGYKTFHGSIAHGVRYLVVLCRLSDGEILAFIDAAYLTAFRTGATSGVASSRMAPEGPVAVAVIGSGLEAETNLLGIAAVRPVRRVRVFSPRQTRREAFARRMAGVLGADVQPAAAPESAVAGADVVLVATNTGHGGPVAFRGEWLNPGQHVVSIGSTSSFLREIDPDTFERAQWVVLDVPVDDMAQESGDVAALSKGQRARLRSATLLAHLVAGQATARRPDEISLYKSVGTAVQDLAAALVLYEAAVQQGIGSELGDVAALKEFGTRGARA